VSVEPVRLELATDECRTGVDDVLVQTNTEFEERLGELGIRRRCGSR